MAAAIERSERERVYARLDARFDEFVADLVEYARVPTISARREAEAEGAEATRRILARHGVPVRLLEVEGGPPMVVGEPERDPARPTLILYNHYDVQPVDPLPEWSQDPFDPVVKDGRLYARGVADTKGNLVAQALAQAAIREVAGALPVNLRFMVEGEEEVGSPHLPAFARRHGALFEADGATVGAATTSRGGRSSRWATRASSTSSCACGRRRWTSTARWPPCCPTPRGASWRPCGRSATTAGGS
jgi:acetylornithine deacetylase/succinyl-diaminopimelate desuccinylase-like protein